MEELRSSRGFCLSDAEEGDNELRHGRVDKKAPHTGWGVSLESRLKGEAQRGKGSQKEKVGSVLSTQTKEETHRRAVIDPQAKSTAESPDILR